MGSYESTSSTGNLSVDSTAAAQTWTVGFSLDANMMTMVSLTTSGQIASSNSQTGPTSVTSTVSPISSSSPTSLGLYSQEGTEITVTSTVPFLSSVALSTQTLVADSSPTPKPTETLSSMSSASSSTTLLPPTKTTQPSLTSSRANSDSPVALSTVPSAAPSADTTAVPTSLPTYSNVSGQNGSTASGESDAPTSDTPTRPATSSTVTSTATLPYSSKPSTKPGDQAPSSTTSASSGRATSSEPLHASLPVTIGSSTGPTVGVSAQVSKVSEVSTPSPLSLKDAHRQTAIISGTVGSFVVITLVFVSVFCYKKRRSARHQPAPYEIENVVYGDISRPVSHQYDEIKLDYEPSSNSVSLYAEIDIPRSSPDSDSEVEFVENDLYSGSTAQLSTFACENDNPA